MAALGEDIVLCYTCYDRRLNIPPQISTDRAGLVVTIESAQFPNVFLRLDGNGVTRFDGGGVGRVNCQYGAGPYEQFILRAYGPDEFSIESLQFPKVFLRLDGGYVTSFQGPGSGIVNGQFGAGPYERFVLRQDTENCILSSRFSFLTRFSAWTVAV